MAGGFQGRNPSVLIRAMPTRGLTMDTLAGSVESQSLRADQGNADSTEVTFVYSTFKKGRNPSVLIRAMPTHKRRDL